MNKKILITLICLGGISFLSAEDVDQNIELPELTTVISSESEKAGQEALPDFNDVLVVNEGSGNIVPVLPDVDNPSSSELNASSGAQAEKDIFAEGQIGGGYPTLFTGDFSVFRISGESPFKLSFSHNSAIGYDGHALTEGFSDRKTKLAVEKSFTKNQFYWELGGAYEALSNGFQNKVNNITALNQATYCGDGKFQVSFSNGLSTGANFDGEFYNRYADVSKTDFPTASVLYLTPEAFLNWEGYGIKAGISGQYWFQGVLNNSAIKENLHRGLFSGNVQWSNQIVCVYGNAGILIGNQQNKNSVIGPFNAGVEASFPVYFANRRVTLGAEGGLDSSMNKISDLERKYKFSGVTSLPSETTDWYGKALFSIPLKDTFTGTAEIEYRQSAFENGYWQPVYKNDFLYKGMYAYEKKDLQQLNSRFALTYHYKVFSITGGWNSYWIDVPVLDSKHQITLDVNFQSEDSKWGAWVKATENLDTEGTDPIIDMEGFVRLTQAVRAVISVEDTIDLFLAKSRVYAGEYITRGGTATFMLKFFF